MGRAGNALRRLRVMLEAQALGLLLPAAYLLLAAVLFPAVVLVGVCLVVLAPFATFNRHKSAKDKGGLTVWHS